ncbi:cell cycle checkpoint protein RAD17 [Xylariaceae sp. FL0255]|nr:cell cycle checkpoint protein RAD17 [Xylariaceae sp. FL0255]
MASILSYVPVVNRLVSSSSNTGARPINVESVEIHDVETAPEKRPRTLKHLLRANHANHSIIYGPNGFHNHMPHILCSAYLLGATEAQLHKIYDVEAKDLDAWEPSPAEISEDDWREYLGDNRYQRAYVDFFEDNLALRHNYDWKKVVEEFCLGGKEPLVNNLIGGLGHPLIHLGYAYEVNNRELAMEALGLAATQYNYMHKYLDDESYTKPSPISSTNPTELLTKMAGDKRVTGLFKSPSSDNLKTLFEKHESLVMEYWNGWVLEDPTKQFQESQEAAVALLVATVPPGTHGYNFFICHLLTTSHAVRILLPILPTKFHVPLVRQWWLFTIAVYAMLKCPKIDPDYVPKMGAPVQWNYVEDKAVNGPYATDAHFVKGELLFRVPFFFDIVMHERYRADCLCSCACYEGSSEDPANAATTPPAMAPPAKRRKRNVVHESDDDDEDAKPVNTLTNYLFSSPDAKGTARTTSPSPSPVRKSSRTASTTTATTTRSSKPALKPAASQSLNGTKSATASPQKKKSSVTTAKGKAEEKGKGKTADLKSLFSKQAERALTKPAPKLDDIISDPISEDDDVGEHRAATASHVGLAARKRFMGSQAGGASTAISTSATSSQKFLRPPAPPHQPISEDEQRPWSERFGPVNLDELAVHKKKVADVRRWLEDVMAGRLRQRLLILKGAAGTGKTTTLRLLAKDMRCELLEWRNPSAPSGGGSGGFQSAMAQFEEFMGRGGKFSQLDTDLDDTRPGSSSDGGNKGRDDGKQKIILIEEFPNTFARSSTAMTSFRKAVLRFLITNTPSLHLFGRQVPNEPITPVVMVISETLLTTTSASADSFTAHRLLGPEINRHPGTCVIEFNAIAPTLLSAALELVVQKEAKKSGRRRTPGPLVLRRLGEIGDIRSAISSLQFLCLKGDADADWGSKVTFAKPKRTIKTSVSLTQGEVETLQLVSQREASLGIFHAVGKVVYNKREETPMDPNSVEGKAEILPDHMAACSRPRKCDGVDVDSLIDETGTDTSTFISALHENYVLSCEPPSLLDPTSFLDYMGGCIDYLSEADLLCPSWDVFFSGRGGGGGSLSNSSYSGKDSASHVLRQEEITFQVATRGLLFSLPSPVKRTVSGSGQGGKRAGKGGDAFKMFYPTSIKLWREKEELEGLVDHWATTLLKGDDEAGTGMGGGAAAFRRPGPEPNSSNGSGNWLSSQRNGSTSTSNLSSTQRTDQTKQQVPPSSSPPLLSLGSAARREMLLERLPYMAIIGRSPQSTSRTGVGTAAVAAKLKEIEKMVSFKGIGAVADDDDEEEGDDGPDSLGLGDGGEGAETWATDKPVEDGETEIANGKKGRRRMGIRVAGGGAVLRVEKLVLSDDDIEDD